MSAAGGRRHMNSKRWDRFCAGFRTPAPTMLTTRSGGRRPKSAKARNRGGDRRRCRNYGDFVAGSGVDVVERGGEMGNFATRHVRELNCERVTDRLCNAILRF